MASVFCIAAGHVATDAVARFVRMGAGEILHVAGKAFGAVELDWLLRLIVWVMARAAPQLTITFACTSASCKLLYMADDFEFPGVRARRRDISIGGENIFQALSRPKIRKLLSRIEYPANTQQVTLFANAVASGVIKLCGIDDFACAGIAQVLLSGAVTTLAGDRLGGEWRRPVRVRGSRDV
jgi:hypothetical protein